MSLFNHRLIKNTSTLFSGAAVGVIANIGIVAFLTRNISIEDYGRVLIVLTLFSFLSAFAGIRANNLIFRFYEKFKTERKHNKLQGLLLLTFFIMIVFGLAICLGTIFLSNIISQKIYNDPSLQTPIIIYAIAYALSSAARISGPIFRVNGAFFYESATNAFQNIFVLLLLSSFYFIGGELNLKNIIILYSIGHITVSIVQLALALSIIKHHFAPFSPFIAVHSLSPHYPEIRSILFHSYIGSLFSSLTLYPGDITLLGMLSSPEQVALYGLGRQFISAFSILENSVRQVITPEIISMKESGKDIETQQFIKKYIKVAFIVAPIMLLGLAMAGDKLILVIATDSYSKAYEILIILAASRMVPIITVVFYPLALSLNLLKYLNYSNALAVLLLVFLVSVMDMSAAAMAWIQIVMALSKTIPSSYLIWNRYTTLQHTNTSNP